jgi:type I restriction-modification system DNA methylase subunit
MPRGRPRKAAENATAEANNGATVGYEAQLWKMADALRGSMDAAEYKHVVLGLIFLKYISDAFEEMHAIIHHLAPNGTAGFVLANGSMSSNQSGEGEIRKNIVEADLVDCMVALPGQLFYSTQIPACLWFLARDKKNHRFRDRRGHVLFIDARKDGPHGRSHPS